MVVYGFGSCPDCGTRIRVDVFEHTVELVPVDNELEGGLP